MCSDLATVAGGGGWVGDREVRRAHNNMGYNKGLKSEPTR